MHRTDWLASGMALAVWLAAATATGAPPPPTSVAVDLASLDEPSYARVDGLALEKRLVLRLVQDGFAVVASPSEASVRLTLSASAAGLVLAAAGHCQGAQREVTLGDEPLAELHLELAQKAVELARSCAPPRVSASPAPPAPPLAAPKSPPVDLTLGAAAGAQLREGGNDLSARFSARLGHRVGLIGIAGVAPSAADYPGDGLAVIELQVLVGPSLRLALGRGLELEVALTAGALVHTFRFDEPVPEQSGARLAFAAALPVTLTLWPVRWFGVGLRAAPGLSRGRRHTGAGDMELWARGPFWFDAGLAVFNRF